MRNVPHNDSTIYVWCIGLANPLKSPVPPPAALSRLLTYDITHHSTTQRSAHRHNTACPHTSQFTSGSRRLNLLCFPPATRIYTFYFTFAPPNYLSVIFCKWRRSDSFLITAVGVSPHAKICPHTHANTNFGCCRTSQLTIWQAAGNHTFAHHGIGIGFPARFSVMTLDRSHFIDGRGPNAI